MTVNEPEQKPSDTPATPGKGKKKPVSGAVLESRPVVTDTTAETAKTDPKPQVESSLVGKPGAVEPATKRPEPVKAATVTDPVKAAPAAKIDEAGKKPDAATPATPTPFGTTSDTLPRSQPLSETKPETKPEPRVETRVEIRRAGFFPLFLGGIVAAGLGAAATYWAIPNLPPSLRPGGEVVDPAAQIEAARQAGADAARGEIQAQVETLADRSAQAGADAARQALADAAPPQPAELPAQVTDRIASLETALAELANRPAAPAPAASGGETAPAAPVAVTPVAPPGVSQEALDALAARVSEQQARIDELAARPVVDPATAEQVQTLARQTEELQQSTADANRRAQAATAATALQTAIETKGPREQALADLSAAGIQVPAVLTGDVPSLDELRSGFAVSARDGLRASLEAGAGATGPMQAIGNFLRVQTGARSIEPRDGNDPDAILSRANAAVEAGDINEALAQIGALPQEGQQAMSVWTGRARVWVEANAALAELAAGSR
ncbi:hypothetical protein RM190_00190 [Paracoccus sp. CPCC 101403]|uniref:Mitochondrial inner membrane protein n=1 Tax=Paracoccus broussonetiae TaxID=3075834 RepID=A0ABU3E7Q9_9RHOB|nr:hypothetical protein [Paracoccus sp. CPCC 101403]MDT1060251.1 hypothetical protein [Paracoccus sp. CPCC 101403]